MRNLVLTLDEEEEPRSNESADELEARHIAETEQLTQVLEACPAVEHLQARTVHPQGGWRFLTAITDKRSIKTFIGGPRPCNPLHSWKSVHFDRPFPLVFEHMSTFELDTPYGGASRPSPVLMFPVVEKCRMSCEIPDDTLFDFFREGGKSLRELYIYQERLIPTDRLVESLSQRFEHLRELKFQLNPSITDLERHYLTGVTPLFDKLFQSTTTYRSLVKLTSSSTEISVRALHHLPPRLEQIEVTSFSDWSQFDPDDLVQTMEDAEVDLKKLNKITVRDVRDPWSDYEDQLKRVCHSRGIEFVFVPNDEEPADTPSGAGSGYDYDDYVLEARDIWDPEWGFGT